MSIDPAPRRAPANGPTILVLGILSIVMLPLLGPIAWIFGNQALAAIKSGGMDPAERGSVTAGRICGIIGTFVLGLLAIFCIISLVFTFTVGQRMVGVVQNLSSSPTPTVQQIVTPAKPTHADLKSLTQAIEMNKTSDVQSIIDGSPGLVKQRDSSGQSPLFTAAFIGSVAIGKILISHGADVNAKDDFGKTPLDQAMFFDHDDFVALLKSHGAHRGAGSR